MNKYCIVTEYGQYRIEAAELTTEYDERQKCDYVLAFDENGQAVGYFKQVIWWIVINNKNAMSLKACENLEYEENTNDD